MKKRIIAICLSFCLALLFSASTYASAGNLPEHGAKQRAELSRKDDIPDPKVDIPDRKAAETESRFKLPASLTVIEDEAFEGTALTSVVLPESLEEIGDYAFAGIETLTDVYIPDAVASIGKHAFSGSAHVTITGAPEGYARAWAQENGIPFSPVASYYAYNKTIRIQDFSDSSRTIRKTVLYLNHTHGQDPKLTGSMSVELNDDRYTGCSVFSIRSRAPPCGSFGV